VGGRQVVERGTSTGESGLWFSLVLRKTGCKLYTHDIDPGRIAGARMNSKLASGKDIVVVTAGDTHETAPKHRELFDILFIDAEKEDHAAYLKSRLQSRIQAPVGAGFAGETCGLGAIESRRKKT
jgi:predicted O-methyltransferase YrrM